MFDDFLPIPDAESVSFYPLVLKLVVCVDKTRYTFNWTPTEFARRQPQQQSVSRAQAAERPHAAIPAGLAVFVFFN